MTVDIVTGHGPIRVRRSQRERTLNRRVRVSATVSVAFALLLASGPWAAAPSSASPPPPESTVRTSDCSEHQAFLDGDPAAVAAQLPAGYSAERNPASGRPLLFVRALRCHVNDSSSPVTFASFGVVITSPDGTRCSATSPADVPAVCNWYVVSWLADDADFVRWLRAGSRRFPVTYVRDLQFEERPLELGDGGGSFRFAAAAPAPSPFTMEATTRERPGEIRVRGAYWAEVREGTVKIGFATDDLASGDATGVVTAPKGSQLATLMGRQESPYLLGYSAIAAEHWRNGIYRKQVIGSSAGATTFDGSCSVAGTVTFEPGATILPQSLRYGYVADGICSGTLDGREIQDAPVTLRQSGRSDGSCARAQTTSPGRGVLTFADGRRLRYNLEFTSVATEIDFTFYGSRSGTARGKGTFRTDRGSARMRRTARPRGSWRCRWT